MGELTRQYDWSHTPVGPVDLWPQSLRTMVDVILHSDVPMFLWWGEDLIQFYNDAYRPSFGVNGKHPAALGQRAADRLGLPAIRAAEGRAARRRVPPAREVVGQRQPEQDGEDQQPEELLPEVVGRRRHALPRSYPARGWPRNGD